MSEFHSDVGSCKIIFGPMFSGKTTKLLQELTTLADVGLKVLYINHKDDKRVTEKKVKNVTTHHSQFNGLSDKLHSISTGTLGKVDIDEYDVIGIDEGQFFDDLDVEVRKWVIQRCKIVIIASLDGDFMMMPFGKAKELICICEPGNIVKLPAICMKCLEQTTPYRRIKQVEAGFSALINVPDKIPSTNKKVGGKESYVSVCMKCYKEHMKISEQQSELPIIHIEQLVPGISNI